MLKMIKNRRVRTAPVTKPVKLTTTDEFDALMSRLEELSKQVVAPAPPKNLTPEDLREGTKKMMIGTLFITEMEGNSQEEQIAMFIRIRSQLVPYELDWFRLGAEAIMEYRRLCSA